jgi:DNA modification methylase
MSTILLIGDVRERLRCIPSDSVHCVVSSPPYFGLRDYGNAAQIGLEPTPEAYIAQLVEVFREVRRVLRPDGTFWLNIGDSYTSQGGRGEDRMVELGKPTPGAKTVAVARGSASGTKTAPGLAPKQRLMIPARVALALQADGWWLRDEIVWRKPNPMPVSVTDRTTPAHEMVYMLTKSARYHYDMEAIKTPAAESSRKRYAQPTIDTQQGGAKQDAYENGFVGQRARSRRPNEILQALARKQDGVGKRQYDGFNDRYEGAPMAQPRSVWDIPTRPFKGAHFATFPPDLVRKPILAGCPVGGIVLDPFFGSGTTALVAAELGRHAIGIELSPEYAAIAGERLGLRALAPQILGRVDGPLPFVDSPPVVPA